MTILNSTYNGNILVAIAFSYNFSLLMSTKRRSDENSSEVGYESKRSRYHT